MEFFGPTPAERLLALDPRTGPKALRRPRIGLNLTVSTWTHSRQTGSWATSDLRAYCALCAFVDGPRLIAFQISLRRRDRDWLRTQRVSRSGGLSRSAFSVSQRFPSSRITLSLSVFPTQNADPSKAMARGPFPTRSVSTTVPSLALSFETVSSPELVSQI